jgi:chromosome condensin MukBEF ATPase and DNA-binding subunit MukB
VIERIVQKRGDVETHKPQRGKPPDEGTETPKQAPEPPTESKAPSCDGQPAMAELSLARLPLDRADVGATARADISRLVTVLETTIASSNARANQDAATIERQRIEVETLRRQLTELEDRYHRANGRAWESAQALAARDRADAARRARGTWGRLMAAWRGQ